MYSCIHIIGAMDKKFIRDDNWNVGRVADFEII